MWVGFREQVRVGGGGGGMSVCGDRDVSARGGGRGSEMWLGRG